MKDYDEPGKLTTRSPESTRSAVWTLAPEHIAKAIERRFDEGRPVVFHSRRKKNIFIYDPGNFWDGPTEVTWEPENGHFSFSGWTGEQHFPMIGPIK